MLKHLKEVSLTTTWTRHIYESKTTDWDGPFQTRETLHDLQLIRGRQGHKDVFKFVQDIYQPLIDMERFSMNIRKLMLEPFITANTSTQILMFASCHNILLLNGIIPIKNYILLDQDRDGNY